MKKEISYKNDIDELLYIINPQILNLVFTTKSFHRHSHINFLLATQYQIIYVPQAIQSLRIS